MIGRRGTEHSSIKKNEGEEMRGRNVIEMEENDTKIERMSKVGDTEIK